VSFKHILAHWGDALLDDIGSASMIEFEMKRRKDGVTPATIRRDLAALSDIFTRAAEWEWTERNPVKPHLRSRRKAGLTESQPRTRILSHEEEKLILKNAPPTAGRMITFALDTGLRKGKQFALLKTDFVMNRGRPEILVRKEVSKSKRSRRVPLSTRSHQLLLTMLAEDGLKSPYLFHKKDGARYSPATTNYYRNLQKACQRSKITEHVTWHDLRRTCGCRLLQDRGATIEEVSAWLGHSSIKVTQERYAFLGIDQLHRRVGNVVSIDRLSSDGT
jgi:integrase